MSTINVVAAIIHHDGKILATQRGYGEDAGGWEFPGGKVEAGESNQEALVREIREELACEIGVEHHVASIKALGTTRDLTIHFYTAHVIDGTPTLLEHSDARWVGLDEVDEIAWLPTDAAAVDPLVEQGLFN